MSKSNYEMVLECFEYILSDDKVDTKYLQRLYDDIVNPLASEGVYIRLKIDKEMDEILMMVRDLESNETKLLIR